MIRVARVVVLDFPHQVTQRGNRRADVFEIDVEAVNEEEGHKCVVFPCISGEGIAMQMET